MKGSEPIISLKQVEMNFGGKSLFQDLSLHIYSDDRICLIGKNGEGKSTLMHLLCGLKEPTYGEVWSMPNLKVGYLPQSVNVPNNISVGEYVTEGLKSRDDLYDVNYLVDMVIEPLSLDRSWLLENLSGGQKRRAALAKALIMKPDLLLLDEPTNHLDITAIEWLEGFLSSFSGAVIVISHDRTFLSNVSRSTAWLDRGVLRHNNRGYSNFDDWSLKIIEQEQRELDNLAKKLQQEDGWLHGGVTARRKRNQRRLNDIYSMREKLKAAKSSMKQSTSKIELEQLQPALSSKLIAEFKNISKGYGDNKIIRDFSYRVMRGDKIGIVGKNGGGKSTFLKLLVGEIKQDTGHIRLGKTIDVTYFNQDRTDLDPESTLWETLCPTGGDRVAVGERSMHVVAYLKKFMFDPKLAKAKVSILSGGQANRLLLAKALASPGNVLILDEPTNDLDMDTLDLLEEILSDFSGTLLLVSHDRDFIDRTVAKILVFEGNGVIDEYLGGYTDYLSYNNKKQHNKVISVPEKKPEPHLEKRSNKMSYKLVRELEELPYKIEKIKEEIDYIESLLSDANLYLEDPKRFTDLSEKLVNLQSELAESELRWLDLSIMKDEMI
jgi:ATP-binding cassette subfamily F protein uup